MTVLGTLKGVRNTLQGSSFSARGPTRCISIKAGSDPPFDLEAAVIIDAGVQPDPKSLVARRTQVSDAGHSYRHGDADAHESPQPHGITLL